MSASHHRQVAFARRPLEEQLVRRRRHVARSSRSSSRGRPRETRRGARRARSRSRSRRPPRPCRSRGTRRSNASRRTRTASRHASCPSKLSAIAAGGRRTTTSRTSTPTTGIAASGVSVSCSSPIPSRPVSRSRTPASDVVSSRNAVTCVGRSVRYRCITAIAAIPIGGDRSGDQDDRATTAGGVGSRATVPAAAKSVIAAPKFAPVHGEPATSAHTARRRKPRPDADAVRDEHRRAEHDADLDVRHPEEAAAVELPAAGERRHGGRPAERGLDRRGAPG